MSRFVWPKTLTKEGVRNWLVTRADGKQATWLLAIVSFTESSFFLIPPDVVLMGILMSSPKRWRYYALVTTVASVLGGLFGYLIGFIFFDTIGNWLINFYDLSSELTRVGVMFESNAWWSVFLSAFTPIPYKVFTIASGFFQINIFILLIASTLGRGLRFFMVGYFMNLYGPTAGRLMYRYFNAISLILVFIILVVVAYIYFF